MPGGGDRKARFVGRARQVGVARAPEGARDVGGLLHQFRVFRPQLGWPRAPRRESGIYPQHAHHAAVATGELTQPGDGLLAWCWGREQIGRQLAQYAFVAFELEAQVLLDPQHVGDECGALVVAILA